MEKPASTPPPGALGRGGAAAVAARWLVLVRLAALVVVMIMLSVGSVDWNSLGRLHRVVQGETAVMVVSEPGTGRAPRGHGRSGPGALLPLRAAAE